MIDPHTLDRDALLAALAWQLDCGVDEAIEDHPVDRTAVRPPEKHAAAGPRGARSAPASPRKRPDDPATLLAAAQSRAEAAAAAADTIEALRAAVEAFDGVALKKGAQSTVFADGDPAAPLMVIGEAPGREEDRVGKPFVGRSGGLLDRMLNAIGYDRAHADPSRRAYVTNVIFYRPLENRTPDDAEVRALLPFTRAHIRLARPRAILCVGNVPAKHVMGADRGIIKFRGSWTDIAAGDAVIPALATFHPAFLLRSPEMKRFAWRDLQALAERLETGDASG